MVSYTHLTKDDRIAIKYYLKIGISKTRIAKLIYKHRSTVYRELKRNQTNFHINTKIKQNLEFKPPQRPSILDNDYRNTRGQKNNQVELKNKLYIQYHAELNRYRAQQTGFYNYSATKAHARYKNQQLMRNQTHRCIVEGSALQQYIHTRLEQYWSPEQIANILFIDYNLRISTQTIYRYIASHRLYKHLSKYLRHNGKYRHKVGITRSLRTHRLNLPSIANRPPIIEDRTRLGDYEGDTIVGKNRKDRVVTVVDRVSGYAFARLVHDFNAEKVADSINKILPLHAKTLTLDRGIEFARYKSIANVDIYFADPYSSYQRGSNENFNGLLRQFIPKGSSMKKLKQSDIDKYTSLINNRPRKRLNYLSPKQYLEKHGVAL